MDLKKFGEAYQSIMARAKSQMQAGQLPDASDDMEKLANSLTIEQLEEVIKRIKKDQMEGNLYN